MSSAVRRNDLLLRYVSALALATVTWMAASQMPFYPPWLQLALAAGVGALAALSPGNASVVFVLALSLPVVAADFVAGMVLVLAGLIVTQYLAAGRAGAFVLAAVGVAGLSFGAGWAAVAVAGYLLGRSRGAVAAGTMALAAIVLGLLLGIPVAGVLATGGHAPGLVALAAPPEAPLGFGWVIPGLKAADAQAFFGVFTSLERPVLVVAQIALWAAAGAAGAFVRRAKPALVLGAVAAIVVGLAVGQFALDAAFAGPVTANALLTAVAISLPFALAVTAAELWVFPLARTGPRVAEAGRERDVDELLRVIASAEDELAQRHNTEAVVLITDMKSFSAMTEEIGSVESAKIVQRHRDLLIPIIKQHHGAGAPTGGDGLVACFRSPADAVAAAIDIQRALEGYTGSDRSPHELSVRVGIASGEVVVDAAGVPFLGAALNLAARVMDLADGGRIMITSYVSSAATLAPEELHRHGEFKLKNIVGPIPVAEVLWRPGMAPQEIRAS